MVPGRASATVGNDCAFRHLRRASKGLSRYQSKLDGLRRLSALR